MLNIETSNKFDKEVLLLKKRGKDLNKLLEIMRRLSRNEILEAKYRNHKLNGNYKDRWECHIEPDWLLIYHKSNTHIYFDRTGTHSDLFK